MSLTSDEQDALREVINIGIGRAAATLSDLIGTRIELAVPRLRVLEPDETEPGVVRGIEGPFVLVTQDFSGPCSGRSALLLPRPSAVRLAQILGGVDQPTDELDLELRGILTEVGNIMLNGVLGSLANQIEARFDYAVPWFDPEPPEQLWANSQARREVALVAEAEFRVRQAFITGELLLLFESGGVETILDAIQVAIPD